MPNSGHLNQSGKGHRIVTGRFGAVPDAEAANAVHRQPHRLVADEIYPVSEQS